MSCEGQLKDSEEICDECKLTANIPWKAANMSSGTPPASSPSTFMRPKLERVPMKLKTISAEDLATS